VHLGPATHRPRLLLAAAALALTALATRPALAQSGTCPSLPIASVDLTALQNAVTAAQNALANAEFLANGKIQEMLALQQAMWSAQADLMRATMTGIGLAAAQQAANSARIAYLAAVAAYDQAMGAVMTAQSALTAAESALAQAIAASGLTAVQLACYGIIVAEVAVVATECVLIGVSYNQYCAAGGTNFAGEVCSNYIYYCNPYNWSNPFR